jgi:hypothetical protein
MIKNGYVMAVIANGNVLEEDESKMVRLPFGTEYKVRLINKNYDRCAADLIINGEKVARFIVNAGETADIERFIDGSMNNGRRFKFTHLNDSQVKDKKDFDNGIVEVHFFREIKKPDPVIIKEVHNYHHWDKKEDPWKPWPTPIWYCDNTVGGGMSFGASNTQGLLNNASCYCSATDVPLGGATVRGSESTQQFSYASGHEFDSVATILKLKIVNGEIATAARYCSGCGRKRKDGDKFCSNCGTRL